MRNIISFIVSNIKRVISSAIGGGLLYFAYIMKDSYDALYSILLIVLGIALIIFAGKRFESLFTNAFFKIVDAISDRIRGSNDNNEANEGQE